MKAFLQRFREVGYQRTADRFHKLYYKYRAPWRHTYWLGVQIKKCPLDLWVYQEILYETRPDLIVECGTNYGGSALYLASLCDLLGSGRILTIDTEQHPERPTHSRITYLAGSSTDPGVLTRVKEHAAGARTVMVVLDSDHTKAHVSTELELYSALVSKGQYLVVEDTNINGHPVHPRFGPGPFEAVDEFLARTHDFVRDRSREKFLLSFNPGGYLKRVA